MRKIEPEGYNDHVRDFRLAWLALVFWLATGAAHAAPDVFPLKDIRAGQRGVGRTVFAGIKVEEFQVEILGVLENIGPKESIILAKLSGGPLEHTGVMQGMSGSPVYIDGKLAGAVALSFPLSKDAIAGIRPIEDMLRKDPAQVSQLASLGPRKAFAMGDARLQEIATPVSFLGFSANTLEQFAPQLRKLGLDPRQGVSGGGTASDTFGDARQLFPGSMISVQLMSGDMSVGADGTVTAIDGARIYAFGHRFLSEGSTDMPFARAEVVTLLPNLQSSFKISRALEPMGTITTDHEMAVGGITGRRASLIPIEIRVGANVYRMRTVRDGTMTPLLVQMAVYSAMETTERAIGPQTYSVHGQLNFATGPVAINDVYSGNVGVAALTAASISSPISFALQSNLDALRLNSVTVEIAAVERHRQQQVIDLLAPRRARPGEEIELTTILAGENGIQTSEQVRYRVPVGIPAGTLNFTVADATQTNIMEYQAAVATPQRTAQQVLGLLNGLRSNTKAYVRVWRAEPSYTVEGRDLPDPPPSLAMVLNRAQAGATITMNNRGAKMAELEIAPTGGNVISGSKTVQIEVRD